MLGIIPDIFSFFNYLVIVLMKIFSSYTILPIFDLFMFSSIFPSKQIGFATYNIAKAMFTINIPSIIPYIIPPDLLNCFIIGKFPIISANKFKAINIILETINKHNSLFVH